MPSPTEDREIEELLSYLETDETLSIDRQTNNASLTGGSAQRLSTLDTISDDEDYDQLFTEVMADGVGMLQEGTRAPEEWCHPHQDQESKMDLS
jgi:hypothetical protein